MVDAIIGLVAIVGIAGVAALVYLDRPLGAAFAFALTGSAIAGFIDRNVSRSRARRAEERRVAELDAEARTREAVEAKVRDFVALVCHDLRAPLNHVVQLAGLVGRDETVSVSDIAAAARAAHRAIRDIEDVYGSLEHGTTPTPVSALVADVLDAYAGEVDARGASITVAGGSVCIPEVCRTVLLNVIGNALKYGGERPRILVSASEADGVAIVRVRDHGRGFEPGIAEKLFGPFFRAHDSQPGSGLGLSFCRQVIDELGGTISAHSDGPGRGATFTFEITAGTT